MLLNGMRFEVLDRIHLHILQLITWNVIQFQLHRSNSI